MKYFNVNDLSLLGITGGLLAFFQPVYYTLLLCLIFLLVDCYTAYRLALRVKRRYGKNEGKFKSSKLKTVSNTMVEIFMVVMLSYMLDRSVLLQLDGEYVTKFAAGFFLFRQLWSILENISSESDNTWAKPLQKIMTNKASRHFEVDEIEFKEYLKLKRDIKTDEAQVENTEEKK
jgi:hypothetical protein